MDAPNEFQPLIDEIFRDKVRWARQESPERKFMDGLELFEEALVRMRGGSRISYCWHARVAAEGVAPFLAALEK